MLSMALFSGPLSYTIGALATARNETGSAWVFAIPKTQATLAKKVFVVQTQLLQAGSSYVGQFEFGLLGCARGLAALRDVLHSTARRLHHLVMGTAALFDV